MKNARILTMVDGEGIREGDVLIDGDTISYVGEKAPRQDYEKVIDCEKNLLMPGFKNAHAHSAMSFARSISDDLPLQKWLYDKIFPIEAKITPEDQYHLSKVSILEYLSSGITSCFDMYYNPMMMAKASIDTGFRSVMLGTATRYRENVKTMVDDYKAINGLNNPLVSYILGFHAEYTADEGMLIELSKAAHELHSPIFTHTSETPSEVEACKDRHHGLTPTEYMDSLGLFDYGGGGFHCVAFSKHDIEIYKKHGLSIVTCPGSNSKLASGIAPLSDFVAAGLNLAIGTDGAGSNNGLDFFYEMRLACVLQKLLLGKSEAFDGSLALKAATIGGAKAMGLNDCLYLKEGQKADIIMIDLSRPNMQPLNNIEKNIVYSGAKDDVKMSMVGGKILYMDGIFHLDEDIHSIYDRAQQITDRIKG